MARNIPIQALRTTRAALDTQAASSGLLAGEPYLITDEDRVAMGTATGAYAECVMDADIGTTVSAAPIEQIAGINPTLDLDFSKQSYRVYDGANGLKTLTPAALLTDLLTFTRASPATYFDAMGVMRSATNSVPRIDYDPATGECKGLLIEEARTNLLTYSEDLRNTAAAGETRPWLYARVTVETSPVLSPNKTSYAQRLLETTDNFTHVLAQHSSTSFVAGTTYTISFYFRAFGSRNFYISLRSAVFLYNYSIIVDALTGEILSNSFSIPVTVTPLANGWFRFIVTLAADKTVITPSAFYLGCAEGIEPSYVGDITKGIDLWGAQLEVGAFPTSYIPTTTAAVTCASDVSNITGANFSKWYSAEGTLLAKYADAGWMSELSPSLTSLDLTDFIDDASQVNDRLERLIFFPRELPTAAIEAITA